MIQDIAPSIMHNEFKNYELRDKDYLISFDSKGKILLGKEYAKEDSEEYTKVLFPTASESNVDREKTVYLFSIDDKRFFLSLNEASASTQDSSGDSSSSADSDSKILSYYTVREVRDQFTGKEVFAVFTAYHLWKWYSDNIYCGKCAEKIEIDKKERALRCPKCGNVIYPRINPAVIVGVTKGDSILITKYRTGYAHNALVAGFTEIGETLEETVAREVMEETGVKVKNIRYYKSQPWGMAQDMLVGFYCEADGDGEIHMDENELKYAEWVKREDIVLQPNNFSLTNEMMKQFKINNI